LLMFSTCNLIELRFVSLVHNKTNIGLIIIIKRIGPILFWKHACMRTYTRHAWMYVTVCMQLWMYVYVYAFMFYEFLHV